MMGMSAFRGQSGACAGGSRSAPSGCDSRISRCPCEGQRAPSVGGTTKCTSLDPGQADISCALQYGPKEKKTMRTANTESRATPQMLARRAFLGRFLRGSASDADPYSRRIPRERIALLKDIGLRWEHRLLPGAVPALRASEACAGHGICASVCPTGALRRRIRRARAKLDLPAHGKDAPFSPPDFQPGAMRHERAREGRSRTAGEPGPASVEH